MKSTYSFSLRKIYSMLCVNNIIHDCDLMWRENQMSLFFQRKEIVLYDDEFIKILDFFPNNVNMLFHVIDENPRKRIRISRSQKNFAEIFLIPIFLAQKLFFWLDTLDKITTIIQKVNNA